MTEGIETQIGGKYIEQNTKLFVLKHALLAQGIGVKYPVGDQIIAVGSFALTEISERDLPWHKTEIGFLRAIRDNPIHIIANTFQDSEGYIGSSAAAELAYAILKGKPVILLHKPVFSKQVSNILVAVFERYSHEFYIEDVSLLTGVELKNRIIQLSNCKVDYQLTCSEEEIIRKELRILLQSIHNQWTEEQNHRV